MEHQAYSNWVILKHLQLLNIKSSEFNRQGPEFFNAEHGHVRNLAYMTCTWIRRLKSE